MYRPTEGAALAAATLALAGCHRETGSPGETNTTPERPGASAEGDLGFRELLPATGEAGVEDLRQAACAAEVIAGEPTPTVLEFVVDVSGSMTTRPPDGGPSRWDITRDALSAAFERLPGSVSVGALFYPNRTTRASVPAGTDEDAPRDPSECVNTGALIEAAPLASAGSEQRRRLEDSLEAVVPAGGTPTFDAYEVALGSVEGVADAGERVIILITDGQPTFSEGCRGNGQAQRTADPRPIIDLVEDAHAAGVRTFVIGSPGSEQVGVPVFSDARTWLSRSAVAGGTAPEGCSDDGPRFCHFDMTHRRDFANALNDVLESVVGQTVDCTYALPLAPRGHAIDRARVNLLLSRGDDAVEVLPLVGDGNCSHGWRYAGEGELVQLCPETCSAVRSDQEARIELLLGCASSAEIR